MSLEIVAGSRTERVGTMMLMYRFQGVAVSTSGADKRAQYSATKRNIGTEQNTGRSAGPEVALAHGKLENRGFLLLEGGRTFPGDSKARLCRVGCRPCQVRLSSRRFLLVQNECAGCK
jgi:hypothetical protein